MAIRSDIWVDFDSSPRVIWVGAPSTEVIIQDLIDTCRYIESDLLNASQSSLVKASGKDDLGGGVQVGLTATLLNARLTFQERTTPVSLGTSTASGSNRFLTNAAAFFITDGVLEGATIINQTDGSFCVVQRITQSELTHTPLTNGVLNHWTIGDKYIILNEVQCNVTGGNLVALDTNGTAINPILASAFTQIVKTSSSSATISELEIANLQRLIEMNRPHHVGTGNIWYWSPVIGDDGFDGKKPSTPVKTFTKAHSLAVDGNHDIILCIPGGAGAPTISTVPIQITKSWVFVRGPGKDFHMHCQTTNPSGSLVDISGRGSEFSGIHIEYTGVGTPPNGILITGDTVQVKNASIEACQDAIHVNGANYVTLDNCHIAANTGHGVRAINILEDLDVKNCMIENNGGTGVLCENAKDVYITSTMLHENGQYGVDIDINSHAQIDDNCFFSRNVINDIRDLSPMSDIKYKIVDANVAKAVWDEPVSAHTTAGTFGSTNQLGGLTSTQATMLLEMYDLLGLYPSKPLVVTQTTRSAGAGIQQIIDMTVATQTTITRTP